MFFAPLSRPSRRRRHDSVVRSAANFTAERLEARRLLAVSVGVNFQPAGSAVPSGYVADSGAAYGNRGNGFTYGWNSLNDTTRDRNATADQLYDTLIHTSGKTWEIAVPNGTYEVMLVAGDPSYFDSKYAFNAEGVLVLSGTPTSGNRFISAAQTVTVNDGRLTITNAAGASNNKLAFLEITDDPTSPPPPPPPPPPPGTVPNIPATIQAEDFDNGGKNVSYFDTTSSNLGGQYRNTEVDIVAANEGGYSIGFTRPGEWLEYTFNVPTGGTFNLDARVASGGAGGVFHVEIDGVDKTGPINLTNSGGWQTYKTLTKTGIAIASGQHKMRVVFDSSNSSGDIGDINWIKFTAASPTTPTVSITASDSSASEPGSNTGKFTITRTGSTASALVINYSIGGSASNGNDYNALDGDITIPAGSSSVDVVVTPKDDQSVEHTEIVTLTLQPISGHNLGNASATVTIADNDSPTPNGDWPASWTRKADFPRERHEARGGTINGKMWIFGGFYSNAELATGQVDYYDIAANKWVTLPKYGPMPHTHSSTVIDGTAIYFVGGLYGNFPGDQATREVWKFETTTQVWSQPFPDLPEALSAGGASIINGKLHYIGGSKADRITDSGRHLVLDMANPSAGWTDAPALPNARTHFSTVTLDEKIYVVGGQHGHEQHTGQLADVHRYDPATQQWTKLADLPTPKSHAENATFVLNGKIYMAGGQINRFEATDEVVRYDPATNQWTNVGKLPAKHASGFVQLSGNKIVVASGNRGTSTPRPEVWVGELE